MKEDKQFTVYTDKYLNCFSVTFSAMLKRLGIQLEYIWGQSGLFFKDKGEEIKITPYYRSLTEDLMKYHGIQLVEVKVSEWEDFLCEVKQLLNENKTVAISVDIFELPYCIYYQNYHEAHAVEVIGAVDNKLIICDHYYQFHGEVDYEDIRRAFYSGMKIYNNDSNMIFHFNIINRINYTDSDLYRVVSENYNVINGKAIEDLNYDVDGAVIGLDAVEAIISKIVEITELKKEQADKYFVHYHRNLKEVANTRHQFHNFLNAYGYKDIAMSVKEASQNWAIVSNIVLQGYMEGDYSNVGPRIGQRAKKILNKEIYNKELLEIILNTKSGN